jgi:hypothetical protein
MTNGGIIEGHTEYSGCNDLSSAISYAGQHSNTAHTSSLRLKAKGRMARSGEMHGLLACKELQSLPHCTRNLGNPYVEKEARLRPQHYFILSAASGLMRGKKGNAAALLLAGDHYLPSRNRIKAGHFTFGSGEFCMQMRVVSGGIKGPSEICATPLPITL